MLVSDPFKTYVCYFSAVPIVFCLHSKNKHQIVSFHVIQSNGCWSIWLFWIVYSKNILISNSIKETIKLKLPGSHKLRCGWRWLSGQPQPHSSWIIWIIYRSFFNIDFTVDRFGKTKYVTSVKAISNWLLSESWLWADRSVIYVRRYIVFN